MHKKPCSVQERKKVKLVYFFFFYMLNFPIARYAQFKVI